MTGVVPTRLQVRAQIEKAQALAAKMSDQTTVSVLPLPLLLYVPCTMRMDIKDVTCSLVSRPQCTLCCPQRKCMRCPHSLCPCPLDC